jgi:hypothetical protein
MGERWRWTKELVMGEEWDDDDNPDDWSTFRSHGDEMDEINGIRVGDRVKVVEDPPYLNALGYKGLIGRVVGVDPANPMLEIQVETGNDDFWCNRSGVVRIDEGTDTEYVEDEVDCIFDHLLNPNDPFESALIDIATMNRRKRADYATDNDIFSNFRGAGARTGLDAGKIVDVMLAIKEERMMALKANGRDPQNESVLDTLLDRAVYGVIGYAIGKEAG